MNSLAQNILNWGKTLAGQTLAQIQKTGQSVLEAAKSIAGVPKNDTFTTLSEITPRPKITAPTPTPVYDPLTGETRPSVTVPSNIQNLVDKQKAGTVTQAEVEEYEQMNLEEAKRRFGVELERRREGKYEGAAMAKYKISPSQGASKMGSEEAGSLVEAVREQMPKLSENEVIDLIAGFAAKDWVTEEDGKQIINDAKVEASALLPEQKLENNNLPPKVTFPQIETTQGLYSLRKEKLEVVENNLMELLIPKEDINNLPTLEDILLETPKIAVLTTEPDLQKIRELTILYDTLKVELDNTHFLVVFLKNSNLLYYQVVTLKIKDLTTFRFLKKL